MNKYHLTSILLFCLGIAFLAISIIRGEGRVALLLFIPIFYGSGIYSFLGIFCLIIAIFVAFFGSTFRYRWTLFEKESMKVEKKSYQKRPMKKRFGGVILLGPIPIIIGSDTKLVIIALLLAIVLIIVTFFLFYWR